MEFNLRTLNSDDLFPMLGIISKIGLDDVRHGMNPERIREIMAAFKAGEQDDATTFLGLNVILDVTNIILKNLPSCKTEIYTFLASVSGMSVDDVARLDLPVFIKLLTAVVKKEEFVDFFGEVAKLFS